MGIGRRWICWRDEFRVKEDVQGSLETVEEVR
jgi:hypothetical protein